jgi:hypothetical protein
MPNWCYNYVIITLPTADLYNKLLESVENKNLFSTFVPLGTEIDDDGNEVWDYDTACVKWGTKWEANEIEVCNNDYDTLTVNLSFDTAWSPPFYVYDTMFEEKNIFTTAYYYESGQEFFGKYQPSDVNKIDDHYGYPSDKEELENLKKMISSDIYDFMECEFEGLLERWEEEENDDNQT